MLKRAVEIISVLASSSSVAVALSCAPAAREDPQDPVACSRQRLPSNVVTIAGCTVDLDNLANLPLRDTCVYTRDQGQIAAGKEPVEIAYRYAPAFALWSDAASKRRWAIFTTDGQAVPFADAQQITSTDNDDWRFPSGTILVKEFSRDGVLLETRLVVKKPDGTFFLGAYKWNQPTPEDPRQTDATFVDQLTGATFDAGPIGHQRVWQIPTRSECNQCHNVAGQTDRLLGFTAVQLFNEGSRLDGFTQTTRELRKALAAKLSAAPPQLDGDSLLTVQGDAVAQGALGYLHGNCGQCHNVGYDSSGLLLRLTVAETAPGALVSQTGTYRTSVDVAYEGIDCNPRFYAPPGPNEPFTPRLRSARADAAHSGLWCRMAGRGPGSHQMPPIGTLLPDTDDGLARVAAWIDALPPP